MTVAFGNKRHGGYRDRMSRRNLCLSRAVRLAVPTPASQVPTPGRKSSPLRAPGPSFATSHFGSPDSPAGGSDWPGARSGSQSPSGHRGHSHCWLFHPQCHSGHAEMRVSCRVQWGNGGFSWWQFSGAGGQSSAQTTNPSWRRTAAHFSNWIAMQETKQRPVCSSDSPLRHHLGMFSVYLSRSLKQNG